MFLDWLLRLPNLVPYFLPLDKSTELTPFHKKRPFKEACVSLGLERKRKQNSPAVWKKEPPDINFWQTWAAASHIKMKTQQADL